MNQKKMRSLLSECLQVAVKKAELEDSLFGVLLIDLDDFKRINNNVSHGAGDELLRIVTNAFQELLKKNDTLIRLDGDQFIIVTHAIQSEPYVRELALNCLTVFDSAFYVQNYHLTLTASIGVVIFPRNEKTSRDLLEHAELALQHAKSQGGNQFQFYNENLNTIHQLTTLE